MLTIVPDDYSFERLTYEVSLNGVQIYNGPNLMFTAYGLATQQGTKNFEVVSVAVGGLRSKPLIGGFYISRPRTPVIAVKTEKSGFSVALNPLNRGTAFLSGWKWCVYVDKTTKRCSSVKNQKIVIKASKGGHKVYAKVLSPYGTSKPSKSLTVKL